MKIALDYDDTYTVDPFLWDLFIASAIARGHDVIVVTGRVDSPTAEEVKINPPYPIIVYYTSGKAKRPFLEEKGIHVDVWIDDRPEYILSDFGGVLRF